ncbi:unnamed protein product, partial [Symbiodinium necroappetens]
TSAPDVEFQEVVTDPGSFCPREASSSSQSSGQGLNGAAWKASGAQQLVLALADDTPQAEVAKGPHKGAADETAKTVLSVVKAAATVGDRLRPSKQRRAPIELGMEGAKHGHVPGCLRTELSWGQANSKVEGFMAPYPVTRMGHLSTGRLSVAGLISDVCPVGSRENLHGNDGLTKEAAPGIPKRVLMSYRSQGWAARTAGSASFLCVSNREEVQSANNVSSAAQAARALQMPVPCHNPSKKWLWLRWLRKRAPPSRALRSQERRKNGWWRAAQTESEHLEAATSALLVALLR